MEERYTKDGLSEINIPVTVGGVTFKNPFYVASGPTTKSVRQLKRIEETGWAAASIKLSIDPAPYINRRPRYSLFPDRNALAFTAEKRLTCEQGLSLIRDAKKELTSLILMANITYAGDDEIQGWVNMARKFEDAGADIIELNMCCPNMSYNLETTSGGGQTAQKQTGASMGQHADVSAQIVAAIKAKVKIPLFVKLTPEGGHIAQVAQALYAAGADAVGGTGNRLGIPSIDLSEPGKAFFHLQKEISMGCYCSGWLKPLAQRDTYEMRKVCGEQPIITATGGIATWKDAVEMILCGGNLLGVCSETLISGFDIVRPMIRGLKDYMDAHGYESLDQMRGLIVPQVRTASDVTIYDGYARIVNPNLSAPCKTACPHHVPVQAYVQKVAKGEFREAFELITGTNALQNICAFACDHPCTDACIRGGIDAPIQIREIKRFVLDYGKRNAWQPVWAQAEDNGHKVAVVGSGAAGLSCAAELRRAGYDVTILERENQLGGSLRFVTPAFRMDASALDETIQQLASAGVHFRLGASLGTDFTLEQLLADGYESVFLAIGAQGHAELSGAMDARSYLAQSRTGQAPAAERVLVVGDGLDATDAARTALRLGARKVTIVLSGGLSRRSGVYEQQVLAQEEGTHFLEHAALVAVSDGGADVVIGGETVVYPCDLVIAADNSRVEENILGDVALDHGGIKAAASTGETSVSRVFAGGDAVRGMNLIGAIASAKRAAAAIDHRIRGEAMTLSGIQPVQTVDRERVLARNGYIKQEKNRIDLVQKAPQERLREFSLDQRVMTEQEAMAEAARCLNCGCGEGCQLCKTICAEFAPFISRADTLEIQREDCVACGMCFNRCPNGNIEMVNLGTEI